MRAFDVAPAVLLFAAAACGGSEFSANDAADASTQTGAAGSGVSGVTSGASGGSGGGGAGGTGGAAGGPKNSGDCQTPADCGGDPCVEVFPGGYRVCAVKIPEAMACSNPPGQCCKMSDCTADARTAKCVVGPVEPYCGGAAILPTNVCASDACASAADCSGPNAICAPAGTLGRKVARCMTGGCRLDRDCTAELGGICSPVVNPCCNQVVGLFCIYSGGCRSNRDCQPTEHCQTDATHAFCAPGLQPCPA